ncbi:MAG: TfoX/Sxy family protein [Sneathiella sp.]
MAYDQHLAERLRTILQEQGELSEKRMMGGACFMLNGHMVGGADRNKDGIGRFMFRVGKENETAALSLQGGETMMQGGRKMSGFFFVPEEICDEQLLTSWVKLAVSFVKSLPPK